MPNKHWKSKKRLHPNHDEWTFPLLEPSSNFTDQVMQSIRATPNQTQSRLPDVKEKQINELFKRRRLVHGMVAVAATYIFLFAGGVKWLSHMEGSAQSFASYIQDLLKHMQ